MKNSSLLALSVALTTSFLVSCTSESEACKVAKQQRGEADVELIVQKENAKRVSDYPKIFTNAAQEKVDGAKEIQKVACK